MTTVATNVLVHLCPPSPPRPNSRRASSMQTICLWDIDGKTHNSGTVDALSIFTGHDAIVEDVQWHPLHDAIFGSVGDDKKIMLYVMETRGRELQWSSVRVAPPGSNKETLVVARILQRRIHSLCLPLLTKRLILCLPLLTLLPPSAYLLPAGTRGWRLRTSLGTRSWRTRQRSTASLSILSANT